MGGAGHVRVAEELEEGWIFCDAFGCLPFVEFLYGGLCGWKRRGLSGTYISWTASVKDVPGKSGELHGEYHLRTRDLHGFEALVVESTNDMADGRRDEF